MNRKHLEVKRINAGHTDPAHIHDLLEQENTGWNMIDTVNWPEYPYKPDVRFRMAHNGKNIMLEYEVNEKTSKAEYGKDNGKVWTDSCVEFFTGIGGDGIYYNLEANCIGTVLLGMGPQREGRERAGEETTSLIGRHSTLGKETFAERETGLWRLSLHIPVEAFCKHRIADLSGITAGANFYKCGDGLSRPHFLSWNPINAAKPDFHRPDFFGTIQFL